MNLYIDVCWFCLFYTMTNWWQAVSLIIVTIVASFFHSEVCSRHWHEENWDPIRTVVLNLLVPMQQRVGREGTPSEKCLVAQKKPGIIQPFYHNEPTSCIDLHQTGSAMPAIRCHSCFTLPTVNYYNCWRPRSSIRVINQWAIRLHALGLSRIFRLPVSQFPNRLPVFKPATS